MIDDRPLYRLRPKEETFSLKMIRSSQVVNPATPGMKSDFRWHHVTLEKIRKRFEELEKERLLADEIKTVNEQEFLWAVRVLLSGDQQHRYWINRLAVRGVRNLRPKTDTAYSYLWSSLFQTYVPIFFPELSEKLKKRKKLSKSEKIIIQKQITPFLDLYNEAMAPVKEALGFPPTIEEQYSFTLHPDAVNGATEECRAYLKRSIPHGVMTANQLHEVKADLLRDYPDEAEAILMKIKARPTGDYLSAISIGSKDGQLVVTIVNTRSQMLTMEGWKFLEMIKNHGTPIFLGDLDRKGNWEPEPLVAFSNNRAGEVHAVYTANDSTIRVICQREHNSQNGKKYTPDKAAFALDQDYLLCLYIAVLQLRLNKNRFDELREQANTKVTADIKELFDPGLFEM